MPIGAASEHLGARHGIEPLPAIAFARPRKRQCHHETAAAISSRGIADVATMMPGDLANERQTQAGAAAVGASAAHRTADVQQGRLLLSGAE